MKFRVAPVLLSSLAVRAFAAPPALQGLETRDLTEDIKRDLAETIWEDIENAATCAACESVLVALKGLAVFGNTAFIDVITELCKISGAEDDDVCEGTIKSEGPVLVSIVKGLSIGSNASQLFCGTLFGLCQNPDFDPFTVSFPKPKPNKVRPPPSGQNPIFVGHISDVHVDLNYTTGANYNCTKPICCRPYTTDDAPGNTDFPAGPFGNTNCDSPLSLEESMVAAIEKINPAFTIFTGDVVAHDLWLVNEAEVITDLHSTYNTQLGSLRTVFPALGNHDVAPVNNFAPDGLGAEASIQYAYDTNAADWTKWIGAPAAEAEKDFGSYSVIYGNLRVISFNSIFYYRLNFWMYQDPLEKDPSGQFAWLISQLQAAEDAGQRAWLISHVPSGSGDYFPQYSNYFDQIVNRYEATIAALFYGHTHDDQFEISYSDYSNRNSKNAVAMSYIAPSLTPTSGSPTFRIYTIDPVTYGVLDFTNYIADISSPSFQNGPEWVKYYSAKAAYGPVVSPPLVDPAAELTPAFWHNVTEAFQNNDGIFQQYISRKSRGFEVSSCTGDCKTNELCQLRAAQSQYNCVTLSPGIHFNKRDEDSTVGHQHEDQCEGSAIRSIFMELTKDKKAFVNTVQASITKRSMKM
ncbi:putative acid sphingomyelinase [Xylogone sp. PMI_703]|nr:putative acid sphingomyelinase [Xylogone sp. PMI_703]